MNNRPLAFCVTLIDFGGATMDGRKYQFDHKTEKLLDDLHWRQPLPVYLWNDPSDTHPKQYGVVDNLRLVGEQFMGDIHPNEDAAELWDMLGSQDDTQYGIRGVMSTTNPVQVFDIQGFVVWPGSKGLVKLTPAERHSIMVERKLFAQYLTRLGETVQQRMSKWVDGGWSGNLPDLSLPYIFGEIMESMGIPAHRRVTQTNLLIDHSEFTNEELGVTVFNLTLIKDLLGTFVGEKRGLLEDLVAHYDLDNHRALRLMMVKCALSIANPEQLQELRDLGVPISKTDARTFVFTLQSKDTITVTL